MSDREAPPAIDIAAIDPPGIERLMAIMARLRDPVTGCEWDTVQTFATIAPYTIEEAYEVADAIERHDMADLKDELGDLLLQVIFHSRMAQEAGDFAILLAAGYSRTRAITLNLASAAGGILGASAMLLFGSGLPGIVPYVLAFAAGSFLYIAMADLIPSLHHGRMDKNVGAQVVPSGTPKPSFRLVVTAAPLAFVKLASVILTGSGLPTTKE